MNSWQRHTMQDRSQTAESHDALEVSLAGIGLINSPRLNKGTAFSEEERDRFGLHGSCRRMSARWRNRSRAPPQGAAREGYATDFERLRLSAGLQDINETCFTRCSSGHRRNAAARLHAHGGRRLPALQRNLAKPEGVFLSYPNRGRIRDILSHPRYDKVPVSSSATASAFSGSATRAPVEWEYRSASSPSIRPGRNPPGEALPVYSMSEPTTRSASTTRSISAGT